MTPNTKFTPIRRPLAGLPPKFGPPSRDQPELLNSAHTMRTAGLTYAPRHSAVYDGVV